VLVLVMLVSMPLYLCSLQCVLLGGVQVTWRLSLMLTVLVGFSSMDLAPYLNITLLTKEKERGKKKKRKDNKEKKKKNLPTPTFDDKRRQAVTVDVDEC
jgi:hypothetical protein